MPESPASPTPYEVLGVSASASQAELRRAYRRSLRAAHPDTGGNATSFTAVQLAWERIGDPTERDAYDQGRPRVREPGSGFPRPAPPARTRQERSSLRARSYGHPGGRAREQFVTMLREWVGRGTPPADPYDPALVRSAPPEIRQALAKALAEEQTARTVSTLGIGFTIWNDVATHHGKVDHVVLGPAGLFALESQDWGSVVRVVRGELAGNAVPYRAEPVRSLTRATRALSKELGVRFTAVLLVVPDDALAEPMVPVGHGRRANFLVIRRSLMPKLLRDGLADGPRTSIGEVFDVRSRLQSRIRFV
ncbi:MAG: DnaJ domain-containing protein [Terrimesophilobacter sp.]